MSRRGSRRGLRLAVIASGRGSNLQALLHAIDRGDLPAQIVVVVSNRSDAGALAMARAVGIPARHISRQTDADPDRAILHVLQEHRVEVVVLAGYLKRVGLAVLQAFPHRVVNIHPAPLRFGGPGMYGERVHAAVLAAGVPTTGPTVHLADEEYDHGRVLAHREVPVLPDDTPERLANRVLEAEHDLYWRAIRDHFCN